MRPARLCLPAVMAMMVACAEPPPAAPVATRIGDKPCPPAVEPPKRAGERLAAAMADPAATPERRTQEAHALGCLLATTKLSTATVVGAAMTGGLSLLVFRDTESVVGDDRSSAVADALGRAYCDPSPDVQEAAVFALGHSPPNVALRVLSGAIACMDPRALAAVDELEARALELANDPHRWKFLGFHAEPLENAAHRDDGALKARAGAALARLGAALEETARVQASSANAERLDALTQNLDVPVVASAMRRALPAFRSRLTATNYRTRLAAASAVWRLEGSGRDSLDALAATLWTGIRVTPPKPAPAAGAKLQSMLAQGDKAPEWDLRRELENLARAGPAAGAALESIRTCLSSRSADVKRAAAVALAFVGRDRGSLGVLRAEYNAFFADSPDAFGLGHGELVAQAVLYLEPDDTAARRALGLGPGPLLTSATRGAIQGKDLAQLLELLLSHPDIDATRAALPR